MTTVQDQNTCNCPVCDSEVLIKNLANFGLTNLHAAIGCAQFEKLSRILKMKKKIYLEYKKYLSKNI